MLVYYSWCLQILLHFWLFLIKTILTRKRNFSSMPSKWKESIFQNLIPLDMPLFNFIKNCLKMSSYSFMRWPQGNCEPSSNHVHIFDRQKLLIQWFIFDLMSQNNLFWYDWKGRWKITIWNIGYSTFELIVIHFICYENQKTRTSY